MKRKSSESNKKLGYVLWKKEIFRPMAACEPIEKVVFWKMKGKKYEVVRSAIVLDKLLEKHIDDLLPPKRICRKLINRRNKTMNLLVKEGKEKEFEETLNEIYATIDCKKS